MPKSNGEKVMSEILTIEKAVQFATKVEANGAQFYAGLAQRFAEDKELSELFSSLSDDEKRHEEQFDRLRKMVADKGGRRLSTRQAEYLEAMAMSTFFDPAEGPFLGVHEVTNRDEALAKVFAFEKATLGYYQAMREALGQSEVLDSLIDTEKQHVVAVAKVMIAGSKLRSLSDRW
jgi:rubrerythrin